ncbi:zinc ABC transporter permease [Propionibacteriaceae bacterium G57]|uniref:zinc ABC transporter permease n=1 Tax=Aestuariimicrobium sp. G57 TaxID=3418485 RepID=UPI003DA75C5F
MRGDEAAALPTLQPARVNSGDEPTESWGRWLASVVVIDFLIGFALLWDRYELPVIGQPAGVPIMALAVGVGAARRPLHRVRRLGWVLGAFAFMLVWAIVVSHLNGLDWLQRSTKMVVLLAFALTIAVGRLHLRSLLQGLTIAMVLNIPLFYAGLTPNNYPPFLTGFFGDKNIAGMMYAVIGVLGLLLHRHWPAKIAHVLVFGAALTLTGSRTSMAAFAVGLLWLWVRNAAPLVIRAGVAVGVVALLTTIEEQFARIWFFRDRDGTDWFREQIDIATAAKLELSPWFGNGLNTAFVQMGQRFMYFHDSYASLRVEGGWVMVVVVLGLFVLVGMHALNPRRATAEQVVTEAAIAVVLVCAWKLGEVFFTTPAFLVLGVAMLVHQTTRIPVNDPFAAWRVIDPVVGSQRLSHEGLAV